MEITFNFSDDWGNTYCVEWDTHSDYTSGDLEVYISKRNRDLDDIVSEILMAANDQAEQEAISEKQSEQLHNARDWATDVVIAEWDNHGDYSDYDDFFSCSHLREIVNTAASDNGTPYGKADAEALAAGRKVECPACSRGEVSLKQHESGAVAAADHLDQLDVCKGQGCSNPQCVEFWANPAKVEEYERIKQGPSVPLAFYSDGAMKLTLDLECSNSLCGLGEDAGNGGWTQTFTMLELGMQPLGI